MRPDLLVLLLLLPLVPVAGVMATESTSTTAFEYAQDATARDKHAEAATLLAEWLALHPDDAPARFLRARVLSWNGNYSESLVEFDILLQAYPSSIDYVLGKGRSLLWSGQWAEAAAHLEFSRQLQPENKQIWQLELQALRAGNEPLAEQRAQELVVRAREQFPDATWLTEAPGREAIANSRYLQMDIGLTRESLSNGLPDWSSASIRMDYHLNPRHVVYGYFRQVQRFNQSDAEMSIGTVVPVAENWIAGIDVSHAPGAAVLPVYAASARLEHILNGGWGIGIGVRHASYTNTYSDVTSLSVERYFKAYRLAYRLSSGKAEDAERTVTHEIRGDYYYHDRSMLGLSLVSGQESESIGIGRLITTDVSAVSLLGQHWFNHKWAVQWRVGYHRQGELYNRAGVDIALRYRF